MKAIWNGKVIAESDETVVVEGNHYFPVDSVKKEFLKESDHQTQCFWKGTAAYHHLKVGEDINVNAVWHYPQTSDAAKHIEGRFAFWKGVEVVE